MNIDNLTENELLHLRNKVNYRLSKFERKDVKERSEYKIYKPMIDYLRDGLEFDFTATSRQTKYTYARFAVMAYLSTNKVAQEVIAKLLKLKERSNISHGIQRRIQLMHSTKKSDERAKTELIEMGNRIWQLIFKYPKIEEIK